MFKKIVCGTNHILVLLNNLELLVSGSNEQGQLGLDMEKSKELANFRQFRQELEGTKNYTIIDIAAGENFSLVLISINEIKYLYRFGINLEDQYDISIDEKNKKQIGHKNIEKIELDYNTTKIKNIYAFKHRSIIITESNEVLMGGIDYSIRNFNKNFKRVDIFPKEIKNVCLGIGHALILDNDGIAYSFGNNTYGELGIDCISLEKPTKISFFDSLGKIKSISTGARHTFALLENGDVYAFGDNSDGQCTGNATKYSKPTKINFESKERIVDIFSNYNHCVLITNEGNLYSWGDTTSGKLGYSEGNLSINIPKEIQTLKGKNVNFIALGELITAISTSTLENSIAGDFYK